MFNVYVNGHFADQKSDCRICQLTRQDDGSIPSKMNRIENVYGCYTKMCTHTRAGKNLRFFKKVFRFFKFLGFNAQSHAERWTQEYDQLKS